MRTCKDCGAGETWGQSPRCELCCRARNVYTRFASGRCWATVEVSRAKKAGLLRSPRGMKCTDCDAGAIEYDHRDYNYPLVVDPVCRRCNVRRGSAIPRSWSFEEFYAWFSKSRKTPLLCDGRYLTRVRELYFSNRDQAVEAA